MTLWICDLCSTRNSLEDERCETCELFRYNPDNKEPIWQLINVCREHGKLFEDFTSIETDEQLNHFLTLLGEEGWYGVHVSHELGEALVLGKPLSAEIFELFHLKFNLSLMVSERTEDGVSIRDTLFDNGEDEPMLVVMYVEGISDSMALRTNDDEKYSVEDTSEAEDLASSVEPDPVADENIEGVHRCPECGAGYFLDIRCGIFRCGRLHIGLLDPHASKAKLDRLKNGPNWDSGCGCPLRYDRATSSLVVDVDPATGQKRYV
jgi:hypothetical protein